MKAAGDSPGLSQCDEVANEVDLSPLVHVSPIERDNVVLYVQYVLDLVAQKWVALAYKLT